MNYKKIAVTAAAGALMLGAAIPVFAGSPKGAEVKIEIKNDKTKVDNKVNTSANTGYNTIKAKKEVKGGEINTGNAFALSEITNLVNNNEVDLCGCLDLKKSKKVEVKIENKDTEVNNNVNTSANTGYNTIKAKKEVKGGEINTGNADGMGLVTNVVNTNVVGNP